MAIGRRPVEEGVRGQWLTTAGSMVAGMSCIRAAERGFPLAGERFTGSESAAVTSPYDGRDRPGPASAPRRRRPAVVSAKAALADGPLPRWKRAEVLDRAARLLAERRDEFAEIIAKEAAKPIKTARVEAERAVGTFQFAAAEARKLAGEVVPLDAIASGRGQGRLHDARADRGRRRDQPVQLPAQPRRPQAGPGDRRRLPGGAQAGEPDAVQRHRPRRAADRGVRAAGRSGCTS